MLWWFLIWQLLCEWQVTITDKCLLTVLYMYDSLFNSYVTPWMKNSSVMLLTRWLPPFLFHFCDWNSNFRLLDLLASEHWSPARICSCYSSFAELLSDEKPAKHVFLELKQKKTLKRVKNVLRQHQILLICLLDQFLPLSISWQCPFKSFWHTLAAFHRISVQSPQNMSTSNNRGVKIQKRLAHTLALTKIFM